MMVEERRRRFRLAFCLALWWYLLVVVVSERIPQHRVKRSTQKQPYRHTLQGWSRSHVNKFWIPPAKSQAHITSRRPEHRGEFLPESHDIRIDVTQLWDENEQKELHWHLRVSPKEEKRLWSKRPYRIRRRRRWRVLADAESSNVTVDPDAEVDEVLFEGEDTVDNWTQALEDNWTAALQEDDQHPNATATGAGAVNITAEVELDTNSTYYNETTNETSSVAYTTTDGEDNTTLFQPMRIHVHLAERGGGGKYLIKDQRQRLFSKILSPAIVAWSAALRVERIEGNLTIDQNQLYDGQTCGPGKDSGYPSVPVPPLHLQNGIPGADLVVYLSVAFRNTSGEENLTVIEAQNGTSTEGVDENKTWVNASVAVSVNASLANTSITANETVYCDETYGNATTCNGTSVVTTGENASSPILNVSALGNGTMPTCSGEYIAASTYCATDQYDRPIAAMMHLCIDESFFDEDSRKRNILTVMHELGHVLGFNPQSMAHFRYPDGTPMTTRDGNGDVVDTTVECTGPKPSGSDSIPLPSENILQFDMSLGVRTAKIVTPTVRQVTRSHFDCHGLLGAALESEDEFVCLGDHWDRRWFRSDLMNPFVDEVPYTIRISPVTLALFADSGWYQIDLSRVAAAAGWGRGSGCSFVNETCVGTSGHVAAPLTEFFCSWTTGAFDGCSPDRIQKARCAIDEFDYVPSEYRYFTETYGSSVGGSELFLDFCPVYTGLHFGSCKDELSSLTSQVALMEEFGPRNSRCVSGSINGGTTALCLQIACVMEDRTLRLFVEGDWHVCETAGEIIPFSGDSFGDDFVVCPDPVRICPTFYCHRDCLGTGGLCDYETGDCICTLTSNSTNNTVQGKCGELQDPDLTPVFYDDLTKEEDYLEDSPLSDYYYDTTPPGNNGNDNDRPVWRVALLVGVVVGGAIFLMMSFFGTLKVWKVFSRNGDDDDGDEPDQPPELTFGQNKSKFVASLLVDMRVHDPRSLRHAEAASQPGTDPETDMSLRDHSDGGFGALSSASEASLDDLHSESAKSIELDDNPVPPSVMRRRFVTEMGC